MHTKSSRTRIGCSAAVMLALCAAVLVVAGGANSQAGAQADATCFEGLVDGEVCVLPPSTNCDENAADPSRSGVVRVAVTNSGSQSVTADVTFGALAPRSLTVPPADSALSTVTARPDGPLAVQVSIGGDRPANTLVLDAAIWCGASTVLQDCVVDATTVQVTFDNTQGDFAVEVRGASGVAFDTAQEVVGTIAAGSRSVVAFTPDDPLTFTMSYLADGASESMRRTFYAGACTYEALDCADTTSSIPADECEAVRDVLEALGWERGRLRGDLCISPGRILCIDGHVRSLSLVDECPTTCDRFTGARWLSPSIARLGFLEDLRIVYNTPVRGPIPPEVGQLARLERLVLNADFEGAIPGELGDLGRLIELVLEDNSLTGSIPESFSNLTALQSFDLSGNQLTGSIPPLFDAHPSLRRIDLADNRFTGTVPSTLFRSGAALLLSGNELDALPAQVGAAMVGSVVLDDNRITGEIPEWIATLDIDVLSMSNNALSGPLPMDFGTWRVGLIDLSSNQLSGPIPDGVGELTLELGLDLSDNQLSGPIPSTIGAITWDPDDPGFDKTFIDLSDNDLSGSISADMISPELFRLDLARNQITGSLAPALFAFDTPYSLRELDLAANQISGSLPDPFPRLDLFDASDNSFVGVIPESIGRIEYLDLTNNALSGSIPPAVLQRSDRSARIGTVRLGGNQLSGPIPTTVLDVFAADELTLLPNGCLTADEAVRSALPRFGVDADRLCETPGEVKFCRDRVVTVDLQLGQRPTPGDDVILGTTASDVIAAGDGDDLICGLTGQDRIWGQGGHDEIHGDGGNDFIRGGPGNDLLFGHGGADDIRGGAGDDEVWGQGEKDSLAGGTGDDLVHGGADGDDLVAGNGGSDNVFGGDGDDRVTGGPRSDVLSGGAGDDMVKGNGGPDQLAGNGGDDELFGGPQSDELDGGDGIDTCNGGTNNAVVGDEAVRCETTTNVP